MRDDKHPHDSVAEAQRALDKLQTATSPRNPDGSVKLEHEPPKTETNTPAAPDADGYVRRDD